MDIKNTNYQLEHIHSQIVGKQFNADKNKVAGKFLFKSNKERSHHAILLSSRFNSNNQEENAPFPGWFIQIVGSQLSLAYGNGKTWNSLKAKTQVVHEKWYKVYFSLNNNTKLFELYLNDEYVKLENVSFRTPCKYINVGALNNKGEFPFNGEIKNLNLGQELVKVIHESNTSIKDSLNNLFDSINSIKNCIINTENDVKSLKDILDKITLWKYRGLQIDTDILEKQITTYENNLIEHTDKIKQHVKFSQEIDRNIKGTDNIENKTNINDLLLLYESILKNLENDIKIIDDAEILIKEIHEDGVDIGNSLEAMNNQKKSIVKVIKDSEVNLFEYLQEVSNIMNIVTLNED